MREFTAGSIVFSRSPLACSGPGRADDAVDRGRHEAARRGRQARRPGPIHRGRHPLQTRMEKLLPKLRKIPFKHEVKRDVTKRENMKALILKEIDEDMTPEEFRANELAMKVFGLLPRDYNLKEALAQVYAEEVAAFYDPKTKTMHLIEEPKTAEKKKPGLLERLFGKKGDFDKDENKTVIAHELTHALADQHYDLDAMQKAVKKDDDRSLALSALIEGEATLAMFGAGMDDWNGEEIIHLPAENLEFTFNLLAPFMPVMGGGKSIRNAPPIISESMTFPYFRGMVFCAKLTNKGAGRRSTMSIATRRSRPSRSSIPKSTANSRTSRCRSTWVRSLRATDGRKSAAMSWARCSWPSCSRSTAGRRPPPAGTETATPSSRARKKSSGWSGSQPGTAKTTPASSARLCLLSKREGGEPGRPPAAHSRLGLAQRRRRALRRRAARVATSSWSRASRPQATVGLVEAALQAKQTEMKPATRKNDDADSKPGRVSAFVR